MKLIKQYLISIIIIFMGFFIVIGTNLFLVKPLAKTTTDLEKEITESNSVLSQKREKLKKLNEMKEKIEEFKKIKEKINSVIPTEKDLPKLYHMMEVIAAESNIKLESMSAGAAQSQGAGAPVSTTFQQISLNFAITAPYDTVIAYLNNLNSFVQITNISDISLSPDGDNVKANIGAYTIYNPTTVSGQVPTTPSPTPVPSEEEPL